MRTRHGTELLIGLVALGLGCGGTMDTGTAKKPGNNQAADDGTCPAELSKCGVGNFAICVDLQRDPGHCGTCDRACTPGIACQAGVCAQTACTGTTIPFSGQPGDTSTPGQLPYGGNYVAAQLLADVNGDGQLDLVEWLPGLAVCSTCEVDLSEFRVSLGQPGGGFASPGAYHASSAIVRVFAADVNSDGLADLYVISSSYQNAVTAPYYMELWLGQSDGHLQRSEEAGISVEGFSGFGAEIAVTDLSGDGWPDLVMAAPDTNYDDPPQISVYLSDSVGALHLSQTFVAWYGNTFVRDWDGDGSPDLVMLSGNLEIAYNRGDGIFNQPVDCALSVGGGSMGERDLLVEDFNRDGRMDLAVGNYLHSGVDVMLGLGGCGFAPVTSYDLAGSYSWLLRAGDLNGDGILDIVSVTSVVGPDPRDPSGNTYATKDNLLAILIGKPDGTFQPAGTALSLGPNVADVTIGDVTGDGRPDIVVSPGQTGEASTWENTCQ
jgi:hypothetical protein